jgi:hypothetical protein
VFKRNKSDLFRIEANCQMMDGGIDMTSDISTSLIVVGVDGSAGSREALQWGVAQSELSGAAVQAVMAWQLPEVKFHETRDNLQN